MTLAVPAVLKRFGDSSVFLVDSAERALQQMMDHVTPTRTLAALVAATDHRSASVRGRVAALLLALWSRPRLAQDLRVAGVTRDLDALRPKVGCHACAEPSDVPVEGTPLRTLSIPPTSPPPSPPLHPSLYDCITTMTMTVTTRWLAW